MSVIPAAPMRTLSNDIEDVGIEEVRKIKPKSYLDGILTYGKFSSWCKQIRGAIEDPVPMPFVLAFSREFNHFIFRLLLMIIQILWSTLS